MTVAVLDPDTPAPFELNEDDVEIFAARGGGPGGQHRNVTASCITARHTPSGETVRIDMKSQHQSRALALRILSERLAEKQEVHRLGKRSKKRKEQVGSGQRGDKIRTYRVRDDRVVDHVTGQKWKFSKWIRGEW